MKNNRKVFWQVFLLLLIFGIILLMTLYFFGKTEYLVLGLTAELIIILNFFVWCYLLGSKKILSKPFILTLIYLLKIGIAAVILAVVYKNLSAIMAFFQIN